MKFRANISLKPYTTFGVEANAALFAELNSKADLPELLAGTTKQLPMMILGEGSNVLFVNDYPGLIIRNNLSGIQILHEDDDHCLLEVAAGVNWPYLVDHTVNRGWGGLENLSLIPGKVGAAPIQNIGAYGVELKETLVEVEVFEPRTGAMKRFSNAECDFGYRTSVFKTVSKGQFIITGITLKLSKKPQLNLSYAPLKKFFEGHSLKDISVKEVGEAVKQIRRSKLPDPDEIGNAGSFFKNPVVHASQAENLKKDFSDIPVYPLDPDNVKVAAGWLIEKGGWKGKRFGDAGVHEKQALVLVNYGNAVGKEIFDLSEKIRFDVEKKFGILLEREVTVV
jgi:UDP-N-acetylmuramate dehydrogenase